MNMAKAYRHGEMCFVEVQELPTGLTKAKTTIFAQGSHGNDHTFKGGDLYLLDKPETYIVAYFVAKKTKLYHKEHSPNGCELPDGIYEVRKQQEFINSELVPVID
jgi:hypothetical protein